MTALDELLAAVEPFLDCQTEGHACFDECDGCKLRHAAARVRDELASGETPIELLDEAYKSGWYKPETRNNAHTLGLRAVERAVRSRSSS